jgi:CheY-like chemotaxis protein
MSVACPVLNDAGHRVACLDSFADAIRLVETADIPDLMVAALRLGAFNGLHLLLRVRAHDADIPAVIIGEASDFTRDITEFGARFVAKPIDPSALQDVVAELLTGRIPRDPQGARIWPRKSAELTAMVQDGAARIVELSYGGVRMNLERPPGGEKTSLEIKLPSLGVSVQAVTRWSKLAEDGGSWWCGAEMAPATSDDTRAWRWIVDSLN